MPQFIYKAKRGPNEINEGELQADNIEQPIAKIISTGQTPLEVKPYIAKQKTSIARTHKNKLPLQALAIFTRQLYDLLDAGLPLLRSLEMLSRQKQHPALILVIQSLALSVKDGSSLSTGMSQHSHAFSPLYVNMVKAGETAGNLPEVLNRLASFVDKDLEMRSRVKSSLLYPVIILIVGVLTLFILLTFVLPRLTSMFDDFGAQLPLATQMVVALSSFFVKFWWVMVIASGVAIIIIHRYLDSPVGRHKIDEIVLKIPLISEFIHEVELARFAHTLGTLLESGIAIPLALESTTKVISNTKIASQLKEVAVKVRSGVSLTQALKNMDVFPEIVVNIVAVGEQTGNLERGLSKLAQTCDRKIQDTTDTFVTILGPAVLVCVVGIVGFMVVAMLLPMFKMNMIVN